MTIVIHIEFKKNIEKNWEKNGRNKQTKKASATNLCEGRRREYEYYI